LFYDFEPYDLNKIGIKIPSEGTFRTLLEGRTPKCFQNKQKKKADGTEVNKSSLFSRLSFFLTDLTPLIRSSLNKMEEGEAPRIDLSFIVGDRHLGGIKQNINPSS
jgi:hypothetical protein